MSLFQRVAAVLGMAAVGGLTMSASAADTTSPTTDGFSIQVDDADELSNFSVSVASASAKVGSQTSLTVTVKAKGDYKGNPKYPHKIKGISGSNVDAPSKVTGSASGKTITFSIPVTPKASGANSLTGDIKFGICDDSQCLMKTAKLNATVTGKRPTVPFARSRLIRESALLLLWSTPLAIAASLRA